MLMVFASSNEIDSLNCAGVVLQHREPSIVYPIERPYASQGRVHSYLCPLRTARACHGRGAAQGRASPKVQVVNCSVLDSNSDDNHRGHLLWKRHVKAEIKVR